MTSIHAGLPSVNHVTVDLIIFTCLDFREFVILELFVKSRICELSISMIVALL